MITQQQLNDLAKKYKINEAVILREYLQVLFLNRLYNNSFSQKIFFKGGTAIHLIFKAPRFSEDLDFTVGLKVREFLSFIQKLFDRISQEEAISFKERKTITGKRYLLTAKPTILPHNTFVNLDFSFREKVLEPKKSIMETEYPVIFNSYIYHLSKEEIAAEKIRALLTRSKGRDLYDLWYLITQNVKLDNKLIAQKLKYYNLSNKSNADILNKIDQFSVNDFILDLRPFVPINERAKLSKFYIYLKDFLKKKLV